MIKRPRSEVKGTSDEPSRRTATGKGVSRGQSAYAADPQQVAGSTVEDQPPVGDTNGSRHQRIEQRAYAIWDREGRWHGSHERHWHLATSEIDAENSAQGEVGPGNKGAGENVCPRCEGTGQVDGMECVACGGAGEINSAIGGA